MVVCIKKILMCISCDTELRRTMNKDVCCISKVLKKTKLKCQSKGE